jgi:O-antigen ligase
MNQEINKIIRFLEQPLTVFILVFQSGLLYFQSFFADPDDPLAVGVTPIDSVLSLVQHFVYLLVLLLLIARWQQCLTLALKHRWVWILTLLTIFSWFWSDFSDIALRRAFVTLETTFFGLYLASRYTLRQQLTMLAWAMGIVTIVSLLFCAAFPGVAIETGGNAGALRGPFAQKNPFARLMVLSSIAFFLLPAKKRSTRLIRWGLFVLSAMLIFLASSKTALILLVVLLLLVPLYRALRWRSKILIPGVIAFFLIFSSFATVFVGNWENLALSIGKDPSLSGRTDFWELAVEKIAERPWLGHGYQSFWIDKGEAEDIWKEITKAQGDYKPPHAHNGFINLSLELGLVGLGTFLVTIGIIYLQSIAYVRSGKTNLELWPIIYTTFFFMYNHSEDTTIAPNSIFWALLVATAFSSLAVTQKRRSRDAQELRGSEAEELRSKANYN